MALTLYAKWTPVPTYTVTWQNENGTVLETDTDVEEGTIPTYDGETPAKAEDDDCTYAFSGWSPEVSAVTGDVTYTAAFIAIPKAEHTHDEKTFTVWTSDNSLPTQAGNYVLTSDVTLSGTWTVPAGETNLCLNGKTINANGGNFAVITIGNGCTLNLYDPEGGGIITGANHTADGGGVAITNGGHFNMYGGSIEGNRSTNGGGLSVNGSNATFHMYGGTIQYNEGYQNTGGILLMGNTVLTLSGGTIQHNAGLNFGGIGTYQATIVIDGDVNISDNYLYSAGTSNKITKSGGVYSLDTTGGTPANVKTAYANDRIKLTKQLALTHKIGVIIQGSPCVFTTGYTTSGNIADPSEYFYSDTFGYNVTLDASGEAALSPIYIRMGTYNGLDVDWFTAGSSGNGLMMVSKYALTNMTFGDNATYSSSNIHNWLEGTFATELGLTAKELSLAKTQSLQYGDGTDKFVIPSYEEFNGKALTKAYYINDPSTVATAYWFRTRRDNTTARVARYQYNTVDMRYSYVTVAEAIRPMFYLDTDACSELIIAGSGTEADPYVVEMKHAINNNILSDAASVLATVKENGTTIYDAALPTKTIADTAVTFSVTPNVGYLVSNIKLSDEGVELTDNQDGTYSFVMPAKDVTVTAEVEKEKFDVTWKNDDGSVIDTTTVEYGDTPTHDVPQKPATEQYIYVFTGWSPEVTAVTADVTYTATYSQTVREYTVTFLNDDGTELQSSQVAYGETPEYNGETPTKSDDAQYTYTFSGWSPEVTSVTGDVTYTAQFEATAKSTADNGYNLTLDDGINVNFLIDTDFYGAEDGYIEYEYIKSSTTESAEREGGSIDVADLSIYSGGNVYDGDSRLTLKAAPAQIAEDYIIRVYNNAGELQKELTVSIADYCEKMQDNATYGELMTALLNYGQLANEYFGYAAKVDGDYEVPHTENYKAELSAEESAALDSLAVATIVNQGEAQVTGVSYIAQMNPEFKFFFTGTSATTAEVSGDLRAKVDKTNTGTTVKVTGLNASDFGKRFTVTVDGTEIEYNGYAYLKAAMNSAALKDLAQGIFRYAQAADKTFN